MTHSRVLVHCLMPLLLSGCATDAFVAQAQKISDAGLEGAEWAICRAAPVGAVLRRYGTSPNRMAAWRDLCQTDNATLFETEQTYE